MEQFANHKHVLLRAAIWFDLRYILHNGDDHVFKLLAPSYQEFYAAFQHFLLIPRKPLHIYDGKTET